MGLTWVEDGGHFSTLIEHSHTILKALTAPAPTLTYPTAAVPPLVTDQVTRIIDTDPLDQGPAAIEASADQQSAPARFPDLRKRLENPLTWYFICSPFVAVLHQSSP